MNWNEVKVFNHPGQMERIAEKTFDEFRTRIIANSVGNDVFKWPAEYIYFVRSPNSNLLNKLRKHGKINIIYSQWEGYLTEEHKQYYTDEINALKQDKDIDFHTVHISGHATVTDIITLAKAIQSKKIIPIHTAFPEQFKKQFAENDLKNVELWEDGNEYLI